MQPRHRARAAGRGVQGQKQTAALSGRAPLIPHDQRARVQQEQERVECCDKGGAATTVDGEATVKH
eukprot:6645791-Pyramimonas_sp.AAC.1